MSRTSSYRRHRSLLAASAAASVVVGLVACGNTTFQNELPIYDGAFAEVDAAPLESTDGGPAADAADSSAPDANDGAAPHEGGSDGGDGGRHDGGDASFDAHVDGD